MGAGQLRERITILSAVTTPDGTGSATTTWQPIQVTPTVSARVIMKSSTPEFNGDKVEYKTNYEIKIRHRDDMDERNRVEYKDQQLKILGIMLKEKRDYLIINCEHLDG